MKVQRTLQRNGLNEMVLFEVGWEILKKVYDELVLIEYENLNPCQFNKFNNAY